MIKSETIELSDEERKRLNKEKIIWFATVSQKSIPHLVPVWFVFNETKIYVCTSDSSVKVKHLKNNPNIAFSLEDGMHVLSGNGKTTIRLPNINKDSFIIHEFKKKYDWDISTDKEYNLLLEITITNLLMRKKQS